ncbi:MAG: bifunctional DNA-formamidopyrimidine glycosylase/DNA-(apurinic or apyrimidinic site) lyase [Patescibacteria group bacterium]
MPELPEVETIKLQLEKYIVGSVIKKIDVKNKKYEFDTKNIIGQKIIGVRRFAKQLSIDLSNNYSIMIHVKMTGQLIYRGSNLPHAAQGSAGLSKKVIGGLGGPHTHVIFNLDKGGKLYFNDIRRFGWIRVIKSSEVINEKFIKNLGPDMLEINSSDFQKIINKSARNIKVLLMDQTKIGGIGNIYANDALWLAKISPKRTSNSLSNQDSKLLYEAIETVLKAGLKYGGASELAFVTPDGQEGEYQNHTLVYGHQGELCLRCSTKPHSAKASRGTVEKYFLGGRGTYICPVCQK